MQHTPTRAIPIRDRLQNYWPVSSKRISAEAADWRPVMIFGNNRSSLRFLEAGKRYQLGAVIGMAGTDGRQDNHSGIAVTTILDIVLGRLLLIIRHGVLPSRRPSQTNTHLS
jgi:hypothetical protein